MKTMKDSGMQWYGEIPSDWNIKRMKFTISDYKSGPFGSSLITSELLEDGDILVYTPEHIAKKSDSVDANLYLPSERKEEMSSFRVNKGDVVFPIVGTLGRAMIITDDMTDGIINQRLAKFRIRENEFTQRFFMWFFSQGPSCFAYIDSQSHGVAIMNITKKMLSDMPVLIPPIKEQDAISDYLDDKCGKIDEAISRHQTIIEKLEEYKRSTIVSAVSGGLSSEDKKDSDIKWLPQIPTSWNVFPLWVLFKERKNKNTYGAETNLLSLSYGKIKRKDIETNEGLLPENFNGYNIIEDGDIVLRLTDLQNDMRSLRTGLVTEHGIITSAYITLKPVTPLNSAYYHYLLHAYDIKKVFYSMGEGVRQNLNYKELCKMLLPNPTTSEQDEIVKYLNDKCEKIDEAIARQKDAVAKLEEYRKSIIYNAVTGKIDCRIGEEL